MWRDGQWGMDTAAKRLLISLAVLITVSIVLTYYRSFVSREYDIIPAEPELGAANGVPASE